jgi:hypothetical protein
VRLAWRDPIAVPVEVHPVTNARTPVKMATGNPGSGLKRKKSVLDRRGRLVLFKEGTPLTVGCFVRIQ